MLVAMAMKTYRRIRRIRRIRRYVEYLFLVARARRRALVR